VCGPLDNDIRTTETGCSFFYHQRDKEWRLLQMATMTVDRQAAGSWQTVDQQMANNFFRELFITTTPYLAQCTLKGEYSYLQWIGDFSVSINQSINRSIDQSINRSIDQLINQSINLDLRSLLLKKLQCSMKILKVKVRVLAAWSNDRG